MEKKSFCIYGAGIVATSIYKAIKTIYGKRPIFFLVSDAAADKTDENPVEIDGIPVLRLSKWQKQMENMKQVNEFAVGQAESKPKSEIMTSGKYLIAAPEVHHRAIVDSLCGLGVCKDDMILITNELENQIMEEYFCLLHSTQGQSAQGKKTVNAVLGKTHLDKKYFEMIPWADAINDDNVGAEKAVSIEIFQAKCHVDKPLNMTLSMPDYVVPIQVGTVFADKKIATVQDNIGDNISDKNRNYCELTASYYAWKNSEADYKGLCHYRRIFDITDAQMQELCLRKEEWDVILPYPSIHYPNISTQHIRYINDGDWQAMMRALEETAPEYYEAYREATTAGEQFFYNYNMLIAKRSVFDDYCDFMFRVLTRAEELTTPKGEKRADRFAGYMGENLTTIYFLKNREHLKIIYAGKKWLT